MTENAVSWILSVASVAVATTVSNNCIVCTNDIVIGSSLEDQQAETMFKHLTMVEPSPPITLHLRFHVFWLLNTFKLTLKVGQTQDSNGTEKKVPPRRGCCLRLWHQVGRSPFNQPSVHPRLMPKTSIPSKSLWEQLHERRRSYQGHLHHPS